MSDQPAFDFRLQAPLGYVMQSEDGSYGVERFLFERWRSMQPHEKLNLVDGASASLRELSHAGVRMRHPGASEAEVQRLGLEVWLGRDCFQRFLRAGMLP